MARRSLGKIHIASHILSDLETAVRYSFEARRGKLYQALRALKAMLIVDLTRQATQDDFTQRELEELAWTALTAQMDEELMNEFRFAYVAGMARRKFKDLDGVLRALDDLVPQFAVEFRTREETGSLDRKGGVMRWLLGTQEVGSIEELLRFASASLKFAEAVLDEDSRFHHLERRATHLRDMLPG